MLVQIAIGDAYGAGFEYASASWIQQWNSGSSYVDHPWHRQGPGRYTDDTQMSIAIAEAVVSGAPWTPDMLAARFVDAFRRDPRTGYSRELEQDIPADLYRQLEDGPYGRRFLEQLDERLLALVLPRRESSSH